MAEKPEHRFIVGADYYGTIYSNQQTRFWLPKARGMLYFDSDYMHFRDKNQEEDSLMVSFSKIVKVKLETMNPHKNKWLASFLASPFYLLFWIPFWNKYILDITYFNEFGQPMELFLRLKTKKASIATIILLKESMRQNK